MSDIERRTGSPVQQYEQEDDGPSYVEIALGLAFLFGGLVFGLLDPPGTLVITFALMIPAAALLGSAVQDVVKQRRKLAPAASKERELLSAAQENGGSITPTEAAMRTSLTVNEADRMLSELAGGGHLLVESEDNTLFYRLPGRRASELQSLE